MNFNDAFSHNESDLKAGALLLSEPFMDDPNFKRSVIVICKHEKEEGSFGFVLNQSVDVRLHELLDDFPEVDGQVFYGGPVQQDTLHYLHTLGEQLEGAIEITPGIWWGGDFDQLKSLLEERPQRVEKIKFFLGYSGWGEGQLMEELGTNSWMVIPGSADLVWNARKGQDWNRILQERGGVFRQISNFPSNPQLN